MAKIMDYTADTGAVHAASYWVPIEININRIARTAQITFLGWVSRDARLERKRPIGQVGYRVGPTDFLAFFPDGSDYVRRAYVVANTMVDENTLRLFFEGATDDAQPG
jgi:hypothetical protein